MWHSLPFLSQWRFSSVFENHQSRRYFVTPLVITRDARNVKYMLKTKFESFVKGETFHTIGHDLLGLGVGWGAKFP